MTDREMLELAAKAARYEIRECSIGLEIKITHPRDGTTCWLMWNPLTDDGDALRLAVKLKTHGYVANVLCNPEAESDTCAEVRRAIVRTAAEIGKAMP